MAEFVKIELTFHARAMEMYTQCYQSLSTQSQQDDLQVSVSQTAPVRLFCGRSLAFSGAYKKPCRAVL